MILQELIFKTFQLEIKIVQGPQDDDQQAYREG